jgi:arylsulfatase A-like enzyme
VKYLEETGRMEDTMIVLTSDHGDYLGDHWLGEKDLFHEQSVKVPLIVYDPSPEADATRGTVCDELVESIDLAATFIEAAGGKVPDHIVEGRSLAPFLRGEKPGEWRDFAVSEYDYSATPMAGDALRRGHRGDARRLCTQGHFAISRRWLGGSGGTDFEIPGTGTADPPGDGAGRS